MPKDKESEVEVVLGGEMDKIFTDFDLSGEQRIKIKEILREWDNLASMAPQKIKIALQKFKELKNPSKNKGIEQAVHALFYIIHVYAEKKYKKLVPLN